MEILRTLLFVPADSPRKMDKARQLRPDGLLLDLEDAVSAESKSGARILLSKKLGAFQDGKTRIYVRVNQVEGHLFAEDLDI